MNQQRKFLCSFCLQVPASVPALTSQQWTVTWKCVPNKPFPPCITSGQHFLTATERELGQKSGGLNANSPQAHRGQHYLKGLGHMLLLE